MHWLDVFAYYEAPTPVTGTAEALVATGELQLLRDADLRTAVTAYLGETRYYTEESDRFVAMLLYGLERVWTEVDPLESEWMWWAAIDSVAPGHDSPQSTGARRSPFPIREGAVLGNHEVYNAVWLMQVSYVSLGAIRRRLRESNTHLTEIRDAALAD